jgi:hypothetical protein
MPKAPGGKQELCLCGGRISIQKKTPEELERGQRAPSHSNISFCATSLLIPLRRLVSARFI